MIVKKALLSTSLVKEIQHRISTNQFAPGDRLPSQDELAAMFGVSRTALREALKQLSLMGLVEVIHGKGTFVRSFTPSALLESLFPQPLMDKKATFDLLEARMHIESAVAFLAAKRADPDDLRELEILVNGMQQDSLENNAESFVEKDLDFHLVVAKASKNPFLAQVLQTIRDMLHKFIIVNFLVMDAKTEPPMKAHIRIFNAIQSHDPETAEKEMRSHLKRVEEFVDKYYEYQENPKKMGENY
jgi:GntR family transcriptional repressor for pyruvate dehydrogenase complex